MTAGSIFFPFRFRFESFAGFFHSFLLLCRWVAYDLKPHNSERVDEKGNQSIGRVEKSE